MGSWFGDAFAASQQDDGLTDEERRQQQAAQAPAPSPTGGFFGQQFAPAMIAPQNMPTLGQPQGVPQEFGQSVPFDPSLVANLVTQQGSPVTYGPRDILGEASQGVGGGFLGAASNLVGNAPVIGPVGYGLNALGVNTPTYGDAARTGMDVYGQDIPVVSPISRDYIQPAAGFLGEQGGNYLNTIGGGLPNQIMGSLGLPSYGEIGRGGAEMATPITFGDYALNALLAPKGAGLAERLTGFGGLDDLLRTPAANAIRDAGGVGQDIIRAGLPEPNFSGANLGMGLPVDPLGKDWIPPVRNQDVFFDQQARGLGGEGAPVQGASSAARSGTEPLGGGPINDVRERAYDTGSEFGYNPAAPNYGSFPSRLETASPSIQEEIRQAGIAANEDAAMVRGMGQTPPPAPAPTPVPDTAAQMQQALDNARALEGGGAIPSSPLGEAGPTPIAPVSPPPASAEPGIVRVAAMPDAVTPLNPNDLVGSRGGVEVTNPAGVRVLQPGEPLRPGEVEYFHGTGPGGLQGDVRAGANLIPDVNDARPFRDFAYREAGVPVPPRLEDGILTPPSSPSVTIGGPTTIDSLIDSVPAPSLNPAVGRLNPVGTGQQLAREAATNPALSQAQRDFLNSPNGQASADQLAGKLESAASGGGTRPPDVPPARGGSPGKGGTRPPSGNPITDAFHGFLDFFYGPFGMDRSDIGRQSIMRTINPFYAADTARSLKASTRAMFDKDFAETLDKGIKSQLDQHGIVPHMADWRGGSGFADRETGVSKIWNMIPGYEALNRGFAAGVNTQRYGPMLRLLDNAPTWAEGERGIQRLQHLANYNAIATGRGTFGGETIDKAIASVTGPLFTSARNAISWPERLTYLFPIQQTGGKDWSLKTLDFFGPAWRTAVKDHSGYIIAGLGIMAGAERLGAKVDYRSGDISVGDHHYNFWGGGYGWVKMAHDVYTGSTGGTLSSPTELFSKAPGSKEYPPFFDTSKGNWRGSAAEFFRNKAGPGLEAIAAGLKVSGYDKKLGIDNATDFLRPEYWDRGVTGRDLGWADRALQFVTFLNLQDIAKSVWAPGQKPGLNLETAGQAAMALPSSVGANANTYASLTDMRRDVKDDPRLPPEIRGVEPSKLGPDGLAAVNKLVEAQDPEKYKDVKEMNSRPVFEKYHETTTKIQQTVDERSIKLYDALREGKINGEQLRQGREIINSSAKAQRDAARNDPEYKQALSELEKNEVSKALDVYYKIWETTPKLPDGKVDYDKVEARQANFLKFADQKDAETAKLLRFELNTEKDRTNPLEKLYDLAKPMLERYGNIKDDYARSMAQANNPREDAFLALLGYGKTQSPEAVQLLQQMRASLPASSVPVAAAAPVQRSSVAAPPPAPAPQQTVAPLPTGSAVGPDGRTVQQIAGNPYKSDAERNWYFESRGLPVPKAGAASASQPYNGPPGTGPAYQTNAQGRTAPINGADIAPVAQRFGISPGPFALLMNHEGNGAHDTSEKGVQPARWGIVQTTARANGIQDTRTMTPEQAYDIAGKYIATGLEQFKGDEAKAYASYYIGAGGVQKAVEQGGDWVKNADRIAAGVGNASNGLDYGAHSMTDFLRYLGFR